MARILVDTMDLDNGLVMKFYDGSKKIAGDRWQVVCITSIDVPVDHPAPETFSGMGVSRDELKGLLGDPVVYEKIMERNFIDDNVRKQVMEELFQSITKSLVPYVSRPEFPGRFLIRKYQEYQRQSAWRKTAG